MIHCHPNARRTPAGRAEVFLAVEAGLSVVAACLAFRVSRRWYYRWLPRWQAARGDGLHDRSSRPLRSPQRLSLQAEALISGLRTTTGWGPDRIAAVLGLARSTVHRAIRRLGLSAVRAERLPVIRYEYAAPGGLIHLDTKKLGRIVDGPGHRAHGDRRTRQRGAGWEVLHVAIDDATRLVYAELLPDERRYTTARFAVRAVRWFAAQGIGVERVLTDNGSAYRSRPFARVMRAAGLRHIRTRPYRPQTNGKVERWIRTVLSECLYLEVFASGEQRRHALERFIAFYNDRRPHLAFKGGPPPRRRLAQLMAAA
jgi:transposase InsO family protein